MTNQHQDRSNILAVSISIGAGLGVMVGALTGDLPIWISIGSGAGVAIGAALSARGRVR